MKKIILGLSVCLISFSCKDTNSDKNKENNPQDKSVETTIDESEISKKSVINDAKGNFISENILEKTIQDFNNCKAVSEKREDCRNAITQFISTAYHINDFKDNHNTDVIYDSIQPIIAKSNNWKNIGNATVQQNLDRALAHTNKGGLALIIDTSKTYGHVVLILSGDAKKSGSWGLNLPKVLSLSNNNPSKSFYNKGLGYAFNKSNDLEVFIRQ